MLLYNSLINGYGLYGLRGREGDVYFSDNCPIGFSVSLMKFRKSFRFSRGGAEVSLTHIATRFPEEDLTPNGHRCR